MGDLYLTGLADWLRAAGLDVRELDGWQYRSRSSGGYEPGRPWCVMWHHTASAGGDGEDDAIYCTFNDSDAPLTNLVIGNTGTVWVCAGGATNTNGKGQATAFSRGIVPADSMNSYAVGIEISNNGVGGAYPAAQVDACFTASTTITARLGLEPDDCCSHNAYAPDRKVDPATATAVQGGWQPRSCTSSGSWEVADLKAECRRRAGAGASGGGPEPEQPEPAPEPEDEDMAIYVLKAKDGTSDQTAARFWYDGRQIGPIMGDAEMEFCRNHDIWKDNGGKGFALFTADGIQGLIARKWAGGPIPKGYTAPKAVDTGTG